MAIKNCIEPLTWKKNVACPLNFCKQIQPTRYIGYRLDCAARMMNITKPGNHPCFSLSIRVISQRINKFRTYCCIWRERWKEKIKACFSIFIFNEKNELLLQQRAKEKYHSGGLWTNTCCSHPRKNETNIEAAYRRLSEEMGMSCVLNKVFSSKGKKNLLSFFEIL